MLKVFGRSAAAPRRVFLLLGRRLLPPRLARLVLIAPLAVFAIGHGLRGGMIAHGIGKIAKIAKVEFLANPRTANPRTASAVLVPQEFSRCDRPPSGHRSPAGAARRGLRLRHRHRRSQVARDGRMAEDLPAAARGARRDPQRQREDRGRAVGGNTVEIVALKSARAGSPEAAKEALGTDRDPRQLQRQPDQGRNQAAARRPDLSHGRHGGQLHRQESPQPPRWSSSTVNGGIELTGLTGRIKAETTNGGIVGAGRRRADRGDHHQRRRRRRRSPARGTRASSSDAPTAASSCGCPRTPGRPSAPASPTAASAPTGCRSRPPNPPAGGSKAG